jgi:hypothetical protein
MRQRGRSMAAILLTACLGLSGCAKTSAGAAGSPAEAARVDSIAGTDLKAVTLTQQAADRLAIRTVVAGKPRVARRASGRGRVTRKVIPYRAVLYDVNGRAWVYTMPAPLTYVRHRVAVDYVEGERAVLSDGPPPGTAIVTDGVAELYGIELGVGT